MPDDRKSPVVTGLHNQGKQGGIMMNGYLDVLKKYAVFTGRARRKEYWTFFLFNFIISYALRFIEGRLGMASENGQSVLANIYGLAVLCPGIAVGIRRMHDVGKSGWHLLIPIYNLILACTEGMKGENQYGPDPKAAA
jgi:uncharacterized membrane protein YhaH (DUF805 family)